MGHFLGPKGAADCLGAMAADPNQRADRILPAAAASNRPVFYAENGRPRSLSEIYDRFARKMDDDAGPFPAAQSVMMAEAAQGSDLPPLPMALARALSAHEGARSEEHKYELQSLMRILYAVLCFKTNKSVAHLTH